MDATAARVSGDFWPKIMASHYIYGAVLWAAAVLFWVFKVLPKFLRSSPSKIPLRPTTQTSSL